GLQSATDGEFRRASWHMDFIYQIGGGRKAPGNPAGEFHNPARGIAFPPAPPHAGSKIHMAQTNFQDNSPLLLSLAGPARPHAAPPPPELRPRRRGARRDRPGGLP